MQADMKQIAADPEKLMGKQLAFPFLHFGERRYVAAFCENQFTDRFGEFCVTTVHDRIRNVPDKGGKILVRVFIEAGRITQRPFCVGQNACPGFIVRT